MQRRCTSRDNNTQIYITKHFTFASLSFMTFYINEKQEYRIWILNLIESHTGPIPVTDVGRLKTGFQGPRYNSSLRQVEQQILQVISLLYADPGFQAWFVIITTEIQTSFDIKILQGTITGSEYFLWGRLFRPNFHIISGMSDSWLANHNWLAILIWIACQDLPVVTRYSWKFAHEM